MECSGNISIRDVGSKEEEIDLTYKIKDVGSEEKAKQLKEELDEIKESIRRTKDKESESR